MAAVAVAAVILPLPEPAAVPPSLERLVGFPWEAREACEVERVQELLYPL